MKFETIQSSHGDNFFYLVADDAGRAALVDPVDAASAIATVRGGDYELRYVINTHFHHDHIAGDDEVLEAFPDAELLTGADAPRIASAVESSIARVLEDGDRVELGDLQIVVLDTPGHTPGHISLLADHHLLSGDTIFVGGAGNCNFGGDPGVLFATFRDVLHQIPDEVTFYPGHDYSVRNLEFALSLEPHNEVAKQVLSEARHVGDDIFVTTLGREREYNPFFRYEDPALLDILRGGHRELFEHELRKSQSEQEAAFRTVRELRNRW